MNGKTKTVQPKLTKYERAALAAEPGELMTTMSRTAAMAALASAMAGAAPMLMSLIDPNPTPLLPAWASKALFILAALLAGFAFRTRGRI